MNQLPTFEEIQKWSDEKLFSVVKSGEKINWDCGINETKAELDFYVESIYIELGKRNNTFNHHQTPQ